NFERLPPSEGPRRVQPHLSDPGFDSRVNDPTTRIARTAEAVLPIYAGLTLALWVGLLLTGDPSFLALCRALGTLSTSGISPVLGQTGEASGFAGEAL
ncbi:MAG: TrkH family potassium uptake protein, partial [Pararhodobacter sp.]